MADSEIRVITYRPFVLFLVSHRRKELMNPKFIAVRLVNEVVPHT